tara:strand:- start:276944 stop:278008 length:1065 start_codon:yes stop_codon:yes gene_type:complete
VNIIVTGGAGFIGSALIRYIVGQGEHHVLNLDKLTYAGNLESIAAVADSDRYHFRQVDICQTQEITDIFDQFEPDIVIHLAAESHVDRSIDGPGEFIRTNIVGTFVLLDVARNYWSGLSGAKKDNFRFHYVSTDEVYGDLGHTQELFTEQTSYDPSSPYSASKASSDHLVRAWQRTYGFPTLITNCSNNYGPYHFPEKLIPHMILNALDAQPLPVYGDGSQVRDWLYVEDHVKALYLVATTGTVGETYNIGGHNEKTNLEVVETICDLLGEHGPEIPDGIGNYKELITFVEDRPGHDVRYAIDASKISDELGWIPEETFESGMLKTINWYLNNRSWWQRVLSGDYQLTRLGTDE